MRTQFTLAAFWLLSLGAVAAAETGKWKLVWSDDFLHSGLPDPEKWTYEKGFVRNNEAQYYTEKRTENARVKDGMLIIEARKERFANAAYNPGNGGSRGRRGQEFAEYTSASLTTRGKAEWTYGRVEVRAKLPKGRGTWPAIWMLGTDRSAGWPACGEIDIMEFVGHNPGVVHANVHTRKYNHTKGNNKGDKIRVPDASEAFHVYAVEWTRKGMDFFVDDQKYFSYENDGTGEDAWPLISHSISS